MPEIQVSGGSVSVYCRDSPTQICGFYTSKHPMQYANHE